MKEVVPVKEESLWLRALKNSSNLFAMVLVLSMIGIVLVSSPASSSSGSNVLTKNMESYSIAYNSAIETIASWTKQYTHPVNQAAKTTSGKFFLIGLSAFFIFIIVDEFFSKRYFHPRIKNWSNISLCRIVLIFSTMLTKDNFLQAQPLFSILTAYYQKATVQFHIQIPNLPI